MKKPSKKQILTAAALTAIVVAAAQCRPRSANVYARAERSAIEVWSVYAGTIEAENARDIISQIRGSAVITEIIQDGAQVTQGMPVAKFDASRWEDDILEAEKNLLLASADYQSLVNAKIPLEIQELESQLMTTQQKIAEQRQALKDTLELRADDLVPEYEVKQLEVQLQTTEAALAAIDEKIRLTKEYLHPSAIQRAQASLTSASNEYSNIKKRLDNSTIRSPANGIAILKPSHFSGDYRSARVGDTVYYSQAFMTVSDMSELVAKCSVPEQELTRITPGAKAVVRPIAFPGMALEGRVASVSSMAQYLPGKKSGSKFFEIVVKLDSRDASLRSDMTAQVHILSYEADNALQVPRAAVWWRDGMAYCSVLRFGKVVQKQIATGAMSNGMVEVLDGLEPGQKVVLQ